MLEVDFQNFFQALDVISLTVDVIFSRHVALIHCGFYFLRDYELEMQLFLHIGMQAIITSDLCN